jgi:hypothetical protein
MNATADAKAALVTRFRELLPGDRREAMPSESHAATFDDNLLPTLNPAQIALARNYLAQGDGKELEHGPTGSPPDAHAANSSSAAAVNLFGILLDRSEFPTIAGLSGFDCPPRLEAKLAFQRGGTPPNLDVLFIGPGIVAGIESKLTESLSRHSPRTWQDSISRPENLALLIAGWRATLDDAIAGTYHAHHLEVGQFLRHALGLRRQYPDAETHLIYCFWEPANGDSIPAVLEHRAEVIDFAERVVGSEPDFHAVTHADLISEWDTNLAPRWLTDHCAAWRTRYDISI